MEVPESSTTPSNPVSVPTENLVEEEDKKIKVANETDREVINPVSPMEKDDKGAQVLNPVSLMDDVNSEKKVSNPVSPMNDDNDKGEQISNPVSPINDDDKEKKFSNPVLSMNNGKDGQVSKQNSFRDVDNGKEQVSNPVLPMNDDDDDEDKDEQASNPVSPMNDDDEDEDEQVSNPVSPMNDDEDEDEKVSNPVSRMNDDEDEDEQVSNPVSPMNDDEDEDEKVSNPVSPMNDDEDEDEKVSNPVSPMNDDEDEDEQVSNPVSPMNDDEDEDEKVSNPVSPMNDDEDEDEQVSNPVSPMNDDDDDEDNAEQISNPVSSKDDDIQRELDSGLRIIQDIVKQNKTTCWPFLDAVDAEALGLWDYHQKIKEPMWLNKIIENFQNKLYAKFSDFARDFRVMVENCYRYNTTEHPISKKAKRLEIVFEGKLALLKKDIRDSATVAKTSNGRFATLPNEGNSTMRSGRVSVPSTNVTRDAESETQGRLVYDFVRCEEAALAEDERLRGYREQKQQQSLYQQVAAAYVSSLESNEAAKHIKTCRFLPEIGLFLHLTETTLKLPPLAMYNLEMSLLTPSDSLYLSKIMTSFLCTYYERSLINQRPPMLFKTWEKRLKQRLEKWFETVNKFNSYQAAAEKLLISVDFFHLLGWKNPFISDGGQTRSFLTFSYHQKAAIIKALCDNLTTFQSIQNNISSLPCEQSRAMSLGFDVSGNEYTYFSQFCGDDVRIYRHRQFGEPLAYDAPDPSLHLHHPKKKEESSSKHDPPPEEESIKNDPSDASDHLLKETDKSVVSCSEDDNTKPDLKQEFDSSGATNKTLKSGDSSKEESNDKSDTLNTTIVSEAVKNPNEETTSTDNCMSTAESVHTDQDVTLNGPIDIASAKSRLMNAVASSRLQKLAAVQSSNKNNDSETCYDSSDAQWTPAREIAKKSKKKINPPKINDLANSPLRRSSRKRAVVNYTSLLVNNDPDNLAFESTDVESFSPKKRQKRTPRTKNKKKTAKIIKIEEPDEDYGSLDFEMVCDSVESIRQLIAAQEIEHDNAVKNKKSKTIIKNVASLLDRLKWLLSELSPFENNLEKARFDAKIRLKREHDAIFRDATTGRAIQSAFPDVDPWEEELISKYMATQGDDTYTYTSTTPPASIYLEESDEESDRELRRSKRRPKRYESDEDYVLDSDEDSPIQNTTFLYNDVDESREILLGAALDELEVRLQSQATTLEKMVGGGRITRQCDFGEAAQLLSNERRTRQRSKKENKVFRKVLHLAVKDREFFGPSLLPLLRTDQTQIGEVVERVLAQEVIFRQQRKIERENEQRRKRDLKQEIIQKNKEVQAKRRAAKKLVQKYKTERLDVNLEGSKNVQTLTSISMWSPPKKHSIPAVTPGISRNNNSGVLKGKAENVSIRMHNGKIGQALRFPDGRVVPIVRMDNAKSASSNNSPVSVSNEMRKTAEFHPHISLSAHRTSLLGRNLPRQSTPLTYTSSLPTVCSAALVSGQVTKPLQSVTGSIVSKPTFVVGTSSATTVRATQPRPPIPIFRPSLPTTAVSQRLTLPSGQVINLVVKQPAVAPQPVVSDDKPHVKSLGRMFLENIANDVPTTPSRPPTNHIPLSSSHFAPASSNAAVMTPSSNKLFNASAIPQQTNASTFVVKPTSSMVSKPLGIVNPMPIKQPSVILSPRPNVEKNQMPASTHTESSYFTSQQQAGYISSVVTPTQTILSQSEQSDANAVTSPQRMQLGMQNVAIVSQPVYQQASAQPVQFMPMVAGSVPLVQPVQFVQTVPLQVNTPVVFVAQGQQPGHVPMRSAADSQNLSYPASSSAASSHSM